MWPPDSKMVMPKVRSFVGSFGKLSSRSLLCLLVIKYLRLGCFAAPRLLRLGQLLPPALPLSYVTGTSTFIATLRFPKETE